jgi:cardiolipin synthase
MNSEKLYFNTQEYHDAVIEDIQNAKEQVWIEMYIFEPDEIGKKYLSALKKAHERGVDVRLLCDSVGSFNLRGTRLNFLKFYHPVPRLFKGKFFKRLFTLNNRDHRKMVVIDQKIVYGGSINIMNQNWQELGVKLTGNNGLFATFAFLFQWSKFEFRRRNRILKIPLRNPAIRLTQGFRLRHYFVNDFLNRMKNANKKIYLASPYFAPKRRIMKKLKNAALRGVDVRLLLTENHDIYLFKFLQMQYLRELVKHGVKVYLFKGSFLHAKTYIVDDWVSVGSSNLNHRSILHDLEIDFTISIEENKKLIQQYFFEDQTKYDVVDLNYYSNWSTFKVFVSKIIYYLRYWS